jgi:molybdenum cofactor guanylyltransferase
MPTPLPDRRDCAAAILAGGRASRLDGADKSALVVGGRSILARQLDALAGVAGELFVVGGASAPNGQGPDGGVARIPDREPGRGPLGGLQAALHHAAAAPVVLIVACDLPFLTHAFLAHLLDRARARPEDVDAVVPRRGGYLHPLCAAYNRRVRDAVDRRVAAGTLAMRALLDDLRVDVIEADALARFDPDGVLFWNVNTPDEYERACARAAMA